MSGNQQADPVQRRIFAYLPANGHGFRMQHGFEDLDGHVRERVYRVPGATGPAA